MGNYNSGRASDFGGINVEQRRADSLNGIRFDASRSAPTSSSDAVLFRNGNDLVWWNGSSSTVIGSVGAVIPSLDGIFAGDKTLNVAGTTLTIDNSTGSNDVLTITNSGASTGALIQITNVGTGSDIDGTNNTWSFSKTGVAVMLSATISGTAGSTIFAITAGDVVMSDSSVAITDADDAASFTVTNSTATTASVVVLAGSGAFTGNTTSSWMTLTPSGLTTGTALYIPVAALTTGKAIHVVANAVTDGLVVNITSSSAVQTATGRLLNIASTAATNTNAVLNEIATAATDETVLLRLTASAALALGKILHISASSMTTGTAIDAAALDALTTGIGLSLASTSTTTTTGSLIRVSTATTGAVATNGIVAIRATGNYTSTSAIDGGLLDVRASATTAGTIVNVVGAALTTGIGLQLSNGTSAITTGSLIRVTGSGVGTLATNGLVSITHAGIFVSTANAGVLDVRTSAMVGTASNGTLVNFMTAAASQVDTTVLNIENSGFTSGYTGSMLRIKSPTTTGTGKLVEVIADGITSGGTAMSISVAALTTGDGLVISNGTAATTTGSLLKVTAGGTGAVSADGIVSFAHTGIYTSTTVGFVNVSASATTGGTVMTITGAGVTDGVGLQISNVAITSGTHLSILGAAGASMFSIKANGATVIAGSASGTAALTVSAGDLVITSGFIVSSANAKGITFTGTGANGGVLKNLKNSANTTANGTAKTVEVDIAGTPYYFLVYPATS